VSSKDDRSAHLKDNLSSRFYLVAPAYLGYNQMKEIFSSFYSFQQLYLLYYQDNNG